MLNLILVLLAAGTAQAKDWRGIIPLHSTRAEVERLLGQPTMDRSDTVVYEYPGERASIEFSSGPCNVEFSPWNVSRGTVIAIWVTPKLRQLNLADLNLSQKEYVKTRDDHRPQIVYYRNESEGIEYSVDEETGTVGLIKYLPAASDEPLRCPEPRNLLRETINFAHYSNISFAAEKKILDRFAQQIIRYTSINYASARAYIFAYGAEHRTALDATSRAERAKEYLVKAHHIDADRIETRNAGFRKRQTIELYLVPAGGTAPRLGSPPAPKRE
jgi:hypothetical protein